MNILFERNRKKISVSERVKHVWFHCDTDASVTDKYHQNNRNHVTDEGGKEVNGYESVSKVDVCGPDSQKVVMDMT